MDDAERRIEVTILGHVADQAATEWPRDIRMGDAIAAWINRPAELTVHLPKGKALRMRTRPILMINRALHDDRITSVVAPTASGTGSLAGKAREVRQLIDAWGVTLDDHNRALLNEWERPFVPPMLVMRPSTRPAAGDKDHETVSESVTRPTQQAGLPPNLDRLLKLQSPLDSIPTTMRVGGKADAATVVTFRVQGSHSSGWGLVVEFSATVEAREHGLCGTGLPATQPTQEPEKRPYRR